MRLTSVLVTSGNIEWYRAESGCNDKVWQLNRYGFGNAGLEVRNASEEDASSYLMEIRSSKTTCGMGLDLNTPVNSSSPRVAILRRSLTWSCPAAIRPSTLNWYQPGARGMDLVRMPVHCAGRSGSSGL
ncbi:MAG: hypothetical protein R2806_08195 [Saprospiraceae bacterium]